MNKDVIKKYKDVFNYWLDGGKVWFKDGGPMLTDRWIKLVEPVTWCTGMEYNPIYVQDDEYAELRKAGADGKQLQVSYDCGKTWYDKSTKKISWNDNQLVRIKPDEPEFKVGDWVKDSHNTYCKILEIDEECINFINSRRHAGVMSHKYILEHGIKPWNPIPEDWCWFIVSGTEFPMLRQLDHIDADGYYAFKIRNTYFKCSKCEPFIGTLPSQLQKG